MPSDRLALATSIDPEVAQAVVRECLVILGIAALTGLALTAPGAGRTFPGADVAVADAIVAAGTTAIVGSLLYAIRQVRALVSTAVVGPARVVDDVAAITGHLVAFGAVLVAYRGLAPAVVPLLDGATWAYDGAFLLFVAVVLGSIARRLYRSLDPIAALLTRSFLEATGYEPSSADASR